MARQFPSQRRHVPENFHALYDRPSRAVRGIPGTPPAQPHSAGYRRLAAEMPDLIISYDEATQLPNRVARQRPTARLSAPIPGSPAQAVTQFIRARGDLWNLTPEDVATVDVLSVSQRGLHTVRLIQRIEGKEVFNSDVTVASVPATRSSR